MNKLTPEEIEKVFALYVNCFAKCKYSFTANSNSKREARLKMSASLLADLSDHTFLYSDFSLLLTPMDQVTDEHAVEVTKVLGCYKANQNAGFGRYLLEDWGNTNHSTNLKGIFVYQYLISKFYAVPLWFGVEHWANGKTAIELGIAIYSTKLNNTDNG